MRLVYYSLSFLSVFFQMLPRRGERPGEVLLEGLQKASGLGGLAMAGKDAVNFGKTVRAAEAVAAQATYYATKATQLGKGIRQEFFFLLFCH